jgi:hypothetical protein
MKPNIITGNSREDTPLPLSPRAGAGFQGSGSVLKHWYNEMLENLD